MYKICAVKAKDKELTEKKKKCKDTFGECKKLEDKSVEYVYKCKTSSNEMKKTLASLTYAKVLLESVNTLISSLLNASTKAQRYKRQDSASFLFNIESLITQIRLTSLDGLGTSSLFISTATTIIQTDTTTTILNTKQITQIQAYMDTITGFIQKIVTRITMITKMIEGNKMN